MKSPSFICSVFKDSADCCTNFLGYSLLYGQDFILKLIMLLVMLYDRPSYNFWILSLRVELHTRFIVFVLPNLISVYLCWGVNCLLALEPRTGPDVFVCHMVCEKV